jgi:primosomal protein N' (replication factor Y)
VAGLDRSFDYRVPPEVAGQVAVGTPVRVDLGGRRVGGWIIAVDVEPPDGLALRPLAALAGWGPEPALVELAQWAAWRWAGRRRSLLRTASAPVRVQQLPPAQRAGPAPPRLEGPLAELVAGALRRPAPTLLRLPPATDPIGLVAAVAQLGPTLVVAASTAHAASLAARLRSAGGAVAVVPEEWASARAGAAVVVGSRAAAWAPCPGIAAAVVLDAHEEALVQEQAPTWSAVAVTVERAARAGVPCLVVSACPTLELVAVAGPVRCLPPDRERAGWAALEVVDRRNDDPRLGLYSEALVRVLRSGRVYCVLNRTGRARLLACAACGSLARCERCGGAVGVGPDPSLLVCRRCDATRPFVCLACASTALRALRAGVSRAREELEALAGRPVGEVTASTTELPATQVLVGTEALLHRAGPAEVVAFLDFDQELLAARLRAGEEALALLARASRLVGGRRRGGRVLVQTRLPGHEVLRAATIGDPGVVAAAEEAVRRPLRLPPWGALAQLSGPAAPDAVAALAATGTGPATPGSLAPDVDVVGAGNGRWLVRAADHPTLCDALGRLARPAGRLRVEVDPVRW